MKLVRRLPELLSRFSRRQLIIASCLIIFVATLALFLVGIEFPQKPNFDEFHYIPSAKQFLALKENQNWEHPPLGKMMMAIGIGIVGDQPLGWRIMSAIFGSATAVGMFLWAFALFASLELAWFATLLTVFNHFLFVQSRIGMLDTFMFGFLVFALAAFTAVWRRNVPPEKARRWLWVAGVCFGLSIACKWAAIVPWVSCLGAVMGVSLLQNWGVSFGAPAPARKKNKGRKREAAAASSDPDHDWYAIDLWQDLTAVTWIVTLVLVPVAVYFATFLPFLFVDREPAYTLWDLVMMQPRMWDGQLRVITSHPYMSDWTSWPWMSRPIWYAFEAEPAGVRGVFLVGNPPLMWGGLIAVLACLASWLKTRSREAFLIVFFYALFYLPWGIIPRKIAFYYYYYPAAMTLGLAVTYALSKSRVARGAALVLVAATFFYFYPILAAELLPPNAFRQWMWFNSWI